jgi:hypothetical protein
MITSTGTYRALILLLALATSAGFAKDKKRIPTILHALFRRRRLRHLL